MIGNFNLGRRKCYRQYQLNVKFMSNLPIYKWEEQISRNPSLLKIQWPLPSTSAKIIKRSEHLPKR